MNNLNNLNDKILYIVESLGNKLIEPLVVKNIVNTQKNTIFIDNIEFPVWSDISLAQGYPGICVFISELYSRFHEEKWQLSAHSYIQKANDSLKEWSGRLSLFGGLSGFAFSILSASQHKTLYTNLLKQINELLIEKVDKCLELLKTKNFVHYIDYDVIEGMTGIGRYLMFFLEDINAKKTLEKIIEYLVELCKDKCTFGNTVPGWYIPNENQFTEREKTLFKKGYFNIGLSHGIPGPLALLSLAIIKGIELPGQITAIKKIVEFLLKYRLEDNNGSYWTPQIRYEDYENEYLSEHDTRYAWCYGTPGVAYSLILASKALQDRELENLAIKSILRITKLPFDETGLYSPTFCHGYSGLLQIFNLVYKICNNEDINKYRIFLAEKIVNCYDKTAPLLFFDTEYQNNKIKNLTKGGLLDGVAGIGLTLLSYLQECDFEWYSAFLLA